MKHHQFEDWLTSGEKLTAEESSLLQEHLLECTDCQLLQMAFTSIEDVLSNAPMMDAPEGFVRRFDSRLEKRLKHKQRIQSLIVFSIVSLTAVVSLILLILSIDFGSMPLGEIFTSFLAFFTTLAAYFTKLFDVSITLFGVGLSAAAKINWLNPIMVVISLIAFRLSSTSLRTSRKGVSYE